MAKTRQDNVPVKRDEIPGPPKALTKKGGTLYVGDPVPGSVRGDALYTREDLGRVDRPSTFGERLKKVAHDALNADGWANLLAGMGGKHDKRLQTFFGDFDIVLDRELERMYFADGVGTRIIDCPADDMTREWIDLEPEDEDTKDDRGDLTAINKTMEELDARSLFNQALKWARLYGGSVMVLGALDGQTLDQPLRPNAIKGIDSVRIIDRSNIDIFQSTFQLDPTQPNFGKPIQLYMYFQVGTMRFPQLVHISRCIMFKGRPVSAGASVTLTLQQRIWGLSELQHVYETLKDYGAAMDNVSNVLYELVLGKYSMDGLKEMMAAGKEAEVRTRMDIMNAAKSVLHALLIDTKDNYTRDTVALAGVSDIIDRFMMKLSAVCGIPITRLFGMSPAGLNATGEHDMVNYYDKIASDQEVYLKPAIRQFIDFIKAWKGLKSDINVKFKPLLQLSETEEAAIRLSDAQADSATATMYGAYLDRGVLMPEQVYALQWQDKMAELMEDLELKGAEDEAALAALEQLKSLLIATPAGSTAASGGASPSLQTPPSTEMVSGPDLGSSGGEPALAGEKVNQPSEKTGSMSLGLVPSNTPSTLTPEQKAAATPQPGKQKAAPPQAREGGVAAPGKSAETSVEKGSQASKTAVGGSRKSSK